MKASNNVNHQEDIVLTKAVCSLAKFYSLSGKDLSQIIGISESSASRLSQGIKLISPHTKEGEIALLLLHQWCLTPLIPIDSTPLIPCLFRGL